MQLKCEICGRMFRTPQGLSGHKQFYHKAKLSQPTVASAKGDSSIEGADFEFEQEVMRRKRDPPHSNMGSGD